MARLENKGVALITGASAGIGATYADRLAKRGYDLLLVARDTARLEALATRLRAETGITAEVLTADLTVKADQDRVAQRITDDKAITLVVNNAGIAVEGGLLGSDPAAIDRMLQLNVVAATRVAVAAAQALAAQGRGALVNIASVLALAPEMFNGAYSGTKAYVVNLSQALDAEAGKHGVLVQAVLPGATRTEIWERAGIDISRFPPEMVMDVNDLVDAALIGLDRGERITIPPLADFAQWEALTAARQAMVPGLSRRDVAGRYLKAA